MHPNFVLVGAFWKYDIKKNFKKTDWPIFLEIPLEGNITIFFFFFFFFDLILIKLPQPTKPIQQCSLCVKLPRVEAYIQTWELKVSVPKIVCQIGPLLVTLFNIWTSIQQIILAILKHKNLQVCSYVNFKTIMANI